VKEQKKKEEENQFASWRQVSKPYTFKPNQSPVESLLAH
jgi:hypothetical protein